MRLILVVAVLAGCSGNEPGVPIDGSTEDAARDLSAQVEDLARPRDLSTPDSAKSLDFAQAPPDLLPACGLFGEPCCADGGTFCLADNQCNVNGVCKNCGYYGGACCADMGCDERGGVPMVCVGSPGACSPCGYFGQECCLDAFCVQAGTHCVVNAGMAFCQ